MNLRFVRRLEALALSLGLSVTAFGQQAELTPDHTALAPGGEFWGQLPFFNNTVALTIDRPAAITREPEYRGTPLYGRVRLGNTSQSTTWLAVDHPKDGAWDQARLYVDANHSGDLTDDGDGSWGRVAADRSRPDAARLGPKIVQLRASYSIGSGDVEVRAAPYSLMFVYTQPDPESGMQLSYRRVTSFVGEIEIAGKTHRTMLVENDNDALLRANKGDDGRPMWLFIDVDGDGRFTTEERFDARYAFAINGQNYLARTAVWGERYMLMPFRGEAAQARSEGAPAAARPPVTRIPLLAAGTPAPDFVALKPDGSELRLSDYRGKTVILDFWATWCGPCIRAMPYLEGLYQQTKDQDVVVLGVCVWDTKEAFDKWQVEPRVRTTFPKAFDPAGRNPDNQNADSIAKLHFNVSGIPTMYVVDRDGKVVEGILGFRGETDTRLTDALIRTGVKL